MTPTTRTDCNENAPASFAGAHGSGAGIESEVCPNCKGRGWVYALSYWDIEIDCGRCDGTGRIVLRQPPPNDPNSPAAIRR